MTDGTLSTDTPLFAGLTIAIILVVGVVSYLPVLLLGPSSLAAIDFERFSAGPDAFWQLARRWRSGGRPRRPGRPSPGS